MGMKTTLGDYTLEENIKNRIHNFFELQKSNCTINPESLNVVAPRFIKILENFKKIADENIGHGITYLMDTIGYYMILTHESNALNEEIIAGYQNLLDEYIDLLGENDDNN